MDTALRLSPPTGLAAFAAGIAAAWAAFSAPFREGAVIDDCHGLDDRLLRDIGLEDRMSSPGRPKSEYRRAQPEGASMTRRPFGALVAVDRYRY